jgi:hypothetical protein
MTDLDKKINELQKDMVEEAKEVLFNHFSAKLNEHVTFIQWSQDPEYYNDEDYSFRIQYLVASSEAEITRIMEDEENVSYRDWHSEDIELVGYEELLERQVDIELTKQCKYDLTRIDSVLAMFGDCTIKITKDKIEVK